ncbi:general secretion pathway protein GspE, partial [Stigmatella aurantiaca]
LPMRKKIGELLVESGAVTEAQVRTAMAQKRNYGKGHRLGSVMVAMGLITPTQLARCLAVQFDMPFVELPEIPPQVMALLSLDFQAEHRIVPFRIEGEGKSERLHVAVEDPRDVALVDELRFQVRKPLRVYVAASDDIDNVLVQARGEKLDIVQATALEEDDGPMRIDRGADAVQGAWAGEGRPSAARAAPPILTPAPAIPPPPPKEASSDFIDDLLGTGSRAGGAPPPPEDPGLPRVPVVFFGGAAKNVKPPEPNRPPNFSEEDLQVLDNLERLSKGEEPITVTQKVMPAQMVAALIRLLINKGVIQEQEFLDELVRK